MSGVNSYVSQLSPCDWSTHCFLAGENSSTVFDPVSCFVAHRSPKSRVWRFHQSTIQSESRDGTLAASRGSVCLRSMAYRAALSSSSWETLSSSLLEPCTRSHTHPPFSVSEDIVYALHLCGQKVKSQMLQDSL